MEAEARALRDDERVIHADVFRAILRPLGGPPTKPDPTSRTPTSTPSSSSRPRPWQYTAGWFQDQTGLTNSTVLQPVDPESVPHRLVNHCWWDRRRDVLPSLVFKRSFHNFVLRVFAENGVAPRPILYRLLRPG